MHYDDDGPDQIDRVEPDHSAGSGPDGTDARGAGRPSVGAPRSVRARRDRGRPAHRRDRLRREPWPDRLDRAIRTTSSRRPRPTRWPRTSRTRITSLLTRPRNPTRRRTAKPTAEPEPTKVAEADPTAKPTAKPSRSRPRSQSPSRPRRPSRSRRPSRPPKPEPKPTSKPVLGIELGLKEHVVIVEWSGCGVDGADYYKVVRSYDDHITWPAGDNDAGIAAVEIGGERRAWDKEAKGGKVAYYRVFCVNKTERRLQGPGRQQGRIDQGPGPRGADAEAHARGRRDVDRGRRRTVPPSSSRGRPAARTASTTTG